MIPFYIPFVVKIKEFVECRLDDDFLFMDIRVLGLRHALEQQLLVDGRVIKIVLDKKAIAHGSKPKGASVAQDFVAVAREKVGNVEPNVHQKLDHGLVDAQMKADVHHGKARCVKFGIVLSSHLDKPRQRLLHKVSLDRGLAVVVKLGHQTSKI